jgi:hypothetical protein
MEISFNPKSTYFTHMFLQSAKLNKITVKVMSYFLKSNQSFGLYLKNVLKS